MQIAHDSIKYITYVWNIVFVIRLTKSSIYTEINNLYTIVLLIIIGE